MDNKTLQLSPGMKKLAWEYCKLKKVSGLQPIVYDKLHELLELASTVEEAKACLNWFFYSDKADDYIKKTRPNINIQFIVACYYKYELYAREHRFPAGKPDRDRITDEYKMMRGKK